MAYGLSAALGVAIMVSLTNLAGAQTAQAPSSSTTSSDIQRDRQDIKKDKHDIAKDHKDLQKDRRDLRSDVKDVKKDQTDLARDRHDLKVDQRTGASAADLRKD